jgi:hypothetical protein
VRRGDIRGDRAAEFRVQGFVYGGVVPVETGRRGLRSVERCHQWHDVAASVNNTWHPVIPNGSCPLYDPRQTLPGCVLKAMLGDPNMVRAGSAERTQLGDGGGSSY